MGLEILKDLKTPKSPSEHEKAKILELVELIKKSDLVAQVQIVWASDLEKMAASMGVSFEINK